MANLNITALTGRLTNDPELKTTTSGTNVVNATIAVHGYKEGDVSFIDCVFFDKSAEILAKYVRKGNDLALSGRLRQRKYETNDGSFRSVTEVIVDNFQLPPKQDNTPMTQAQALNGGNDVVIEDIDDKPIVLPEDFPF